MRRSDRGAQRATQHLGITQPMLREHIAEMNRHFDAFTQHPNITVVDTHALSQQAFPAGTALFSADGFHPSDAGYEAWADLLWTALDKGRRHHARTITVDGLRPLAQRPAVAAQIA